MITRKTQHPRRARRPLAPLLAVGLAVALAAGCGGDDEKSAQDRYCETGASLEASVDALVDLDLLAEGTDGLQPKQRRPVTGSWEHTGPKRQTANTDLQF